MKIFTIAHVPDTLGNAWLQHLREFDATHRDCHFEVMSDVPDMKFADIVKMLQLNPKLDFQTVLEREKPEP